MRGLPGGCTDRDIVGRQGTVKEKNRLDPLRDLILAVVGKLSGFELADPAPVPMIAATLLAAAMGRAAVAWRDQYGTIPPQEALAHTFVLWHLADLYDLVAEQPGATDQLMRETFKALAPGAGCPGCAVRRAQPRRRTAPSSYLSQPLRRLRCGLELAGKRCMCGSMPSSGSAMTCSPESHRIPLNSPSSYDVMRSRSP
ncbi:hypothetical protein [Streptomyces sp. NPDC017964]|uniref:hypothetical protein n=1 Tax=Streptomyces sp. NPDC017964 TaxID=3365022 RepID=UPI0037A1F952